MRRLTLDEFHDLMQRLASGWQDLDTELALSCFTADAFYSEPPDIQIYMGHEQLRSYFAALKPGTLMRFQHLWFDEDSQTGAGEYTFGSQRAEIADHGVAVIELKDGRIAIWREYQRKGPLGFDEFTAADGKQWLWHIDNYP